MAAQSLRRSGDRTLHAARVAVAGDRQYATLATRPGLGECVREQRQRPRFVDDVAHEQIDEPRLEAEARLARRPFDGLAQLRLGHGPQEVQTIRHEAAQRGMRRCRPDVVGTQHDDDRARRRSRRDRIDEPVPGFGIGANREQLLGLVDDEDRVERRGRDRGRDRRRRVRARNTDRDGAPLGAEHRHEPGAQE